MNENYHQNGQQLYKIDGVFNPQASVLLINSKNPNNDVFFMDDRDMMSFGMPPKSRVGHEKLKEWQNDASNAPTTAS